MGRRGRGWVRQSSGEAVVQKGTSATKTVKQDMRIFAKWVDKYVEEKGVVFCLDAMTFSVLCFDELRKHNLMAEKDERSIVEAIGSDYVLVYFDTGNAVGIGYDVIEEIEGLGKYIAQVHIKDNPSDKMLGKGGIDFKAVIEALKKVAFDGYLMLETQSTEDSITVAAENLAYLKKSVGT